MVIGIKCQEEIWQVIVYREENLIKWDWPSGDCVRKEELDDTSDEVNHVGEIIDEQWSIRKDPWYAKLNTQYWMEEVVG